MYKNSIKTKCIKKVNIPKLNNVEVIETSDFDMVQMNIGNNHGLADKHNQ